MIFNKIKNMLYLKKDNVSKFQGPPGINATFCITINQDQVVQAMWDLRHGIFLAQMLSEKIKLSF